MKRSSLRTLDSNPIPAELRWLVKNSVAILGEVICQQTTEHCYQRIERLRREMTSLRNASAEQAEQILSKNLMEFRDLPTQELLQIAHAYSLMLELMNACENAFRSYRLRPTLRSTEKEKITRRPERIIYVVTAHPTEARSPQNIAIFQEIQKLLTEILVDDLPHSFEQRRAQLQHHLEIAWKIPTSRQRKPKVEDEAEHVYSILLKDEVLSALLKAHREIAPLEIHSWVGGDKDGHPGVNAVKMTQSLNLSRNAILRFVKNRLTEVYHTLNLLGNRELKQAVNRFEKLVQNLRTVRSGDGKHVSAFHAGLQKLNQNYRTTIGASHPSLDGLVELIGLFPGVLLPLELRESSEIVVEASRSGKPMAITRMIQAIRAISQGGNTRWYVASFILSMTSTVEQLQAAQKLLSQNLGKTGIPVVPLFEQQEALENAPEIVGQLLADTRIRKQVHQEWNDRLEIMLGYSDSAKEIGVLPSRMTIRNCLFEVDSLCHSRGIKSLFFHGQGGSIDRGGGSITEQVAGWPRDALRLYKTTIQGEMVERSFASPEIIQGQLEKIVKRFDQARAHTTARSRNLAMQRFVEQVTHSYQMRTSAPDFMSIVEKATAYRFLSTLKMGSRPVSRTKAQSIASLRAIPWVLCWTQTRVLFPTWWGVGTAWKSLSPRDRESIRKAFQDDPLFSSYVKVLGFTLAKVELPIWRMHLENSSLHPEHVQHIIEEFSREYSYACTFVRALSGKRDLVWFRPWLSKSIQLRSPMIHPLNLIQMIALERKNPQLLRETVTGISSGMMTTG